MIVSIVHFFDFRFQVSGYQVSALPLAAEAVSLIEKETSYHEVSYENYIMQWLKPET